MPYRSDRRDRAKSFGLVVAVHAALGLALVAGLRGPELIRAARERFTAIDVQLPLPPPPPPASSSRSAPKSDAGAVDRAAKAAPIVLPPPPRPLPSPLPVAREVGPVPGAAPTAGAGAQAGTGKGAGSTGSGDGGGGNGDGGSGIGDGAGSGARWLGGGLSRSDYRAIRSFAVQTGSAAYAIRVDEAGQATGCRPRQSSGSAELDAMICDMLVSRLRFDPARDGSGRPRPDEVTYIASWSRR